MTALTPPKIGCIADDFTGATDLASHLVRSGLRTLQLNGIPADNAALNAPADAVVIALKTRNVTPAEAVAQSLAALRWLHAQGVAQIYFKYCSTFDSTPQGNIGPVIDALLDALAHTPGSEITIACPALPQNQRTVYQGHLFVGDQLLSDSGMRRHPLTPMTDANLVRVLQAQTRHPVGLVRHAVVTQGAAAIGAQLQQLRAQGVRIAVVDALTEQDLMHIGAATQGMALVTAGSGVALGLAQNWPELRTGPAATNNSLNATTTVTVAPSHWPAPQGRQAILSGSCSNATRTQVRHFQQLGHPHLFINPLEHTNPQTAVTHALLWADTQRTDVPLLIYASSDSEAVKAVQTQLGEALAGQWVEDALAGIAVGLLGQGVRQLVVAGGETSGAVTSALGVQRMWIGAQIDPGVPWTAVESPLCPNQGLHMALKSGNFGSEDFFTKAFAQLNANGKAKTSMQKATLA